MLTRLRVWRVLAKDRSITIATIVTLGFGIGLSTIVVTVVKRTLFDELPYANSPRLVVIGESDGPLLAAPSVSFATTEDWKQRNLTFERLVLWSDLSLRPLVNGQVEFLRGMRVSFDYFDALGVKMHIGRSFTPDEDTPTTRDVLIVTYEMWMRLFRGDMSIIGRKLPAVGSSYTIVGVLPPHFTPLHMSNPGESPEIFAPLGYNRKDKPCRTCRLFGLIGLLKQGVSPSVGEGDLRRVTQELTREFPGDYPRHETVTVVQLKKYITGKFDSALWTVLIACAALLLIGGVNVANLNLIQSLSLQKQVALLTALGAPRWRLLLQNINERLTLAIVGGAAGLLLAWFGLTLLPRMSPKELPRVTELSPGWDTAIVCLLVSLMSGLIIGAVTAARTSSSDLSKLLRDSSTSSASSSLTRQLSFLVVTEIAIAFALALIIGLLSRSYLRVRAVDLGYKADKVWTVSLLPDSVHYNSPEKRLAYYDAVSEASLGVRELREVDIRAHYH